MADVYFQSQHVLEMSAQMEVDGNKQINELGKTLPREVSFQTSVWCGCVEGVPCPHMEGLMEEQSSRGAECGF